MTDIVQVKVVVAGPFNAGKTTLVSTLSEIPVVSSEQAVTDGSITDVGTTVAMDYGRISIGGSPDEPAIHLHLFGTPGQQRFDYMWDISAKGMLGLVIMVDASRPDSWDDATAIAAHFAALSEQPFVVGANKATPSTDTAAIGRALGVASELVIPCQANEVESAKNVLLQLLEMILAEQLAHESAGIRDSEGGS